MFDLREHKGLIRRLVSEANQNDPNWKWSIKAINKTEARIFWSYLECGDQKPCFTIELVEDEDGCLIYAKDEHGDNLNSIIKMQADRIKELEEGVESSASRVMALENENVHLKARLYDILMK